MLKIFDKTEGFETKVNFVDDGNRVVGYDMKQHYCEDAYWYFSDNEKPEVLDGKDPRREATPPSLDDYQFDPTWSSLVANHPDLNVPGEVEQQKVDEPDFDYGGAVSFRLISPTMPPIYLHLVNVHNGYYSHGFTFDFGEGESKGHI